MSRASVPLAGFQVTLIGRFWVIPEVSKAAIGTTIRDLFFKILANFSKTAWTPRVASCSHYYGLYGCDFRFT